MRRATAFLALPLLVLAACGSSGDKSTTTSSSAPSSSSSASTSPTTSTTEDHGAGQTVKTEANPSGSLKFEKTKLTAKAGTVTLAMENPSSSGVPHAIAVEGHGVDKDGQTTGPGGNSTVTVKLKAGTYKFYCPVDGHEKAGMTGVLVVR